MWPFSKKPYSTPIKIGSYVNIIYDDCPNEVLERARLINKKACEYVDRLSELNRQELSGFGTMFVQKVFGLYYPDKDELRITFWGPKQLSWRGKVDQFINDNTGFIPITGK